MLHEPALSMRCLELSPWHTFPLLKPHGCPGKWGQCSVDPFYLEKMELNGISAGGELANPTPDRTFPGAHALPCSATRRLGVLTLQDWERENSACPCSD